MLYILDILIMYFKILHKVVQNNTNGIYALDFLYKRQHHLLYIFILNTYNKKFHYSHDIFYYR